jgi:hypothetical protein
VPTYIYAIAAPDHPVRLEGLKGVGEPPGGLRTVRTDSLTAVVSEAPADLRAKRRDMVAHQSVLERLTMDGPALPMRFGLLGPDDDQVLAVLEEYRETYTGRLKEIDGCVEFNLKVSRDEDDLLREIVGSSDEVRRLNDFTRQNPEARDLKVALGELLSREALARQSDEGRRIVERLAPNSVCHSVAEPAKTHFLNASFLVRRGDAESFTQAVNEEVENRGSAYSLSLHGPLPPYSFV